MNDSAIRTLIEQTPLPMALLDRDLRYLLVSGSWFSRHGLAAQEAAGRSHLLLFPDLPQQWLAVYQRCLSGAVESAEADSWPRSDGTTGFLRWTVQPWRDAQGAIGGIVIFSEPVTGRVERDTQLAALQAELVLRARRLETLALASAQILWTTDAGGAVVEDSPSWRAFTGQSVDEFRGPWGFLAAIHPDDRAQVRAAWMEVLSAPRPYETEYRLRRPDGSFGWMLARAAPVMDGAGNVREWIGSSTDISGRKAAEEALRTSEARLQAIVDSAPAIIYLKDLRGRYLLTNREFERATGAAPGTLLGKTDFDLIGADTAERWAALDRRVSSSGAPLQLEQSFVYDGLDRHFLTVKFPVRDAGGQIYAVGGTETEVTAQKRLEILLRDSERRFRTLAESSSDIVWTTGADGKELVSSKGWDEFVGRGGWDALHPDDLEQVKGAWAAAVAARAPFEARYRLLRRDGTFVAVLARGTPVLADDGSIREWVGTIVDVTERNRADAQLHFLAKASVLLERSLDPEQAMNAIVSLSVPDFADACSLDLLTGEGAIEQAAVAHRDPAKAALMRDFRRRYPPDPQAPRGAAAVLRSGKAELMAEIPEAAIDQAAPDREYARLLKEIGLRSLIVVPLIAGGERLGAMAFAVSSGERRYAESDVRVAEEIGRRAAVALQTARLFRAGERARKDAEAASRAKDEFLAMLGHELRNPLAPIVTALQLLKLRGDLKLGREQAILDRQVKHLIRLVDDLLDISRVTRGMVELRREKLELHTVVARAVEMASPLLEQKLHSFSARVPHIGMRLNGDETRLAQAIGNLLTNAARYTPPGGSVVLDAAREGDELVVKVRDNGNGIRPELLPRVFDLFVQGDRSIERAEGGLGIGLTLVRTFIAMHGGSVAAFSDGPGKGSEFVLRLPALPIAPIASSPPRPDAPARHAHALRVLVVDDNEDAAELLGEALAAAGHEVRIAHDAPEALAAARDFAPEVAVLDIGLPVMDGYELASRLRGDPRPPRLIAVTGYGQQTDRARSQAAGFERHLVKPVDLEELLAALS